MVRRQHVSIQKLARGPENWREELYTCESEFQAQWSPKADHRKVERDR